MEDASVRLACLDFAGTPTVTSFIGYNDVSLKAEWRNFNSYPTVYIQSLNYGSYSGSGGPV